MLTLLDCVLLEDLVMADDLRDLFTQAQLETMERLQLFLLSRPAVAEEEALSQNETQAVLRAEPWE